MNLQQKIIKPKIGLLELAKSRVGCQQVTAALL